MIRFYKAVAKSKSHSVPIKYVIDKQFGIIARSRPEEETAKRVRTYRRHDTFRRDESSWIFYSRT